MKRALIFRASVPAIIFLGLSPAAAQAQRAAKVPGSMAEDLTDFVETPAVPGHEGELAAKIRNRLKAYAPTTDRLGDVIVTLGSGAPHRLLVTPLDEPGYVVSGINDQGYLRVQRLPQFAWLPLFDTLYAAQPVRIESASGKWIDGVVAGLSTHLQPGRQHSPNAADLDEMYVDVGASSAAEARRAGADVLSPLAMDRRLYAMGFGKWTALAVGDRFGAAALVELLRQLDPTKVKGTLTVAFVTQEWTGARGLERVLERTRPDELIFVGRLLPSGPLRGMEGLRRAPRREPGSGVLVGLSSTEGTFAGLAADLKRLADAEKIPLLADYSTGLFPPTYLPLLTLPDRWVHLGIAVAWPSTPAEFIYGNDLADLVALLEDHFQGSSAARAPVEAQSPAEPSLPERPRVAPSPEAILRRLVKTYGVSGHEEEVRDAILRLLPPWAKPVTDDAGNLTLYLGAARAKAPRLLFVAHIDEIGFEVRALAADGRLEVRWRGGGITEFFAGHAAWVHSANGVHPGVMELPEGWEKPGFQWPRGRQATWRVDVGARSAGEAEQLGIKIGDWVTIPKKYRRLAGTRASGRSFDDRVGCAALISAVWSLGPELKDRDVMFAWSTREELGLVGAAALAKRLAAEKQTPDYVFAVDTFVSSDSPLESPRFAGAALGKGFVVRAVDNSNLVPRNLVERVLRLARENRIPAQYGVTGGGNDGAAFLRYGSVDVALGWPLRYSHSPGEVLDTRDLDALARIVAAIARSW